MTSGVMGEYGLEDVAKINDILREASVQKELAQKCLSEMQKRQEDILHEIEFAKLNAPELAKLVKELRDVRIKRRIAKNTLQIVGPIIQWQEQNQIAYNRISTAIAATRKIDKEQREAVYHIKAGDREGEVIEHAV